MKLTFQKAALLNGINIVLKAVPSKTTMPILECILIDATTEIIKFSFFTSNHRLIIRICIDYNIVIR